MEMFKCSQCDERDVDLSRMCRFMGCPKEHEPYTETRFVKPDMSKPRVDGVTVLGVALMFDQFLAKVFEQHPEQIPTDPVHLKPLRDSFAAGIIGIFNQSDYLIEKGFDDDLMFHTRKAWKLEADIIIYEE